MIQFPPIQVFDDGELNDGKKLAKKILEEAAELMVASQHDTREHMLDEFADVLQTLANFYGYSGITQREMDAAMERCLQKNIDRGRITDPRPFVDRVTLAKDIRDEMSRSLERGLQENLERGLQENLERTLAKDIRVNGTLVGDNE